MFLDDQLGDRGQGIPFARSPFENTVIS